MRQYFASITLLCLMLLTGYTLPAQELLNPLTQPQFVNPLPIPAVLDARSGGAFTFDITQFNQHLGLVHPQTGQPMATKVWGYRGTYPGPTILAHKDVPVAITWNNKLLSGGEPLPHLLPIDPTVNWALKHRSDWQQLGVPVVTHLHGGHTESASDGLPDAWYTPDFVVKGQHFVKEQLYYHNDQEAATLWYHDHAMGITRLNVYAGLAGYYLLTDAHEKSLQDNYKIPSGAYDIGLAIQDRMFTADGQLYYPSLPASMGVPEPSVAPEFFGDFILVNGTTWPVLEVEPRPYRFRILNGSDSRFYNLTLGGLKFTQIAGDGGLLPLPVDFTQLLIGTGERKDVVIDFSKFSGQTIVLKNNAKTPYPKGAAANPLTTGRIMAFKVTKPLSNAPKTVLPATLRPPLEPLQSTLPPRKLILFESTDEYGRLKPMLGTMEDGVMNFHDPATENPMLNSTEIWDVYNQTMDAHTIHLHLVQMQLISRQKFSASVDMETGKPSNVRLIGAPKQPGAEEKGWKDTYVMLPGEVTRVIATFDREGHYVWHCHILSHEDHEMMRPLIVGSGHSAMASTKIVTATAQLEQQLQLRANPNPFNNQLHVQLNLAKESQLAITIYDAKGARLQQVTNSKYGAGRQQFNIDGSSWTGGTYYLEVIVNNQQILRKLVLQK
mgnify:CR=1 FL=1